MLFDMTDQTHINAKFIENVHEKNIYIYIQGVYLIVLRWYFTC